MSSSSPHRIALRLQRSAQFGLSLDLALPPTGVTVLFGPSGSGKTTLLRCVAGLERADAARVEIGGEVWEDSSVGLRLQPWKRPVGFVFQEPSLFPHLTVRENIAFARRRSHGAGRGRIPWRTTGDDDALGHARGAGAETGMEAVISMLGLGSLLDRHPFGLSGGEQQRVAIARALATQPRLLLLDEPLAALDPARRQEVLPWLERLRDELGLPMLYVTHSVDEMARLANTVVLMRDGQASACGPVTEIMRQVDADGLLPEDVGTLVEADVVAQDVRWHLMRADFPGGSLWLRDDGKGPGRRVRLRVLARDVSLAIEMPRGTTIQNQLPGRVEAIEPDPRLAGQAYVTVACGEAGESRLLARVTARAVDQLALAPGMPVWAQVKAVALVR